ncbi:MAG: hypothetical protein GY914_09600, partial [Prochlorococcus sp.]|nr:hypothetical protein [Prochlorococcus sp.]
LTGHLDLEVLPRIFHQAEVVAVGFCGSQQGGQDDDGSVAEVVEGGGGAGLGHGLGSFGWCRSVATHVD